jgi:hypothetical protein
MLRRDEEGEWFIEDKINYQTTLRVAKFYDILEKIKQE